MSNRINSYYGFHGALNSIEQEMKDESYEIHTEQWQANDITDMPEALMREIMNVSFTVHMNPKAILNQLREDIKPNLPWADDHFEERVCGEPLNPGKEWENWPWAKSADRHRMHNGEFNHNYMERYWPKYANHEEPPEIDPYINRGIRHNYGDLQDVIDLLVDQPLTRQAYLPVWFPEDTGLQNTGRKPCSLGYQFIVRKYRMSIHYFIRSCDYYRHLRDDIYLTVRLLIWVLGKCRFADPLMFKSIKLGDFHMHITSLHMFIGDYNMLFGGKNDKN